MLLCLILLNTAEDNQRRALAQITPAPEKFGGADDSSTINQVNDVVSASGIPGL